MASPLSADTDYPQVFLACASPMLLVAADAPDFTVTDVNQAYLAATMRTRESLVGRALFEAMPDNPDDPVATGTRNLRSSMEQAIASGKPDRMAFQKYDITTPNGGFEERWWDPVNTPIKDASGRVTAVLHQVSDVTARIRAESALRALNADLESQIITRSRERSLTWTVSSELLSVIDLRTGCFDRVNPAWAAVLGWTPQEMEGVALSEFLLVDDVDASKVIFDRLRDGEPMLKFENRCRTKDGDWRWLSWVAVPFEGKLYSSTRDVHATRLQADSLAVAEDALRQAQKMEAVVQLTGGVAHDFNNLLTVIRGSVDLLRRPNLDDSRRARYIDAIGDTADRAAKLTAQLLAFARRQVLKPETFDAGESLNEVAAIIRTLTGSRIVLETIVPDEPCFILADKGQFDTAIVNMSINARDAMEGEGSLTIAVGPISGIPAIRSHAPIAGDYVAVTVTDDGSGISAEHVTRIFEPFFTTKVEGQGTGLGLSQVIGFAKQSDGDIQVESSPGKGTTFTLYLPRMMDEAAEPVGKIELPTVDGEGICVLVVEDNSDVGEFAVQALRELGYKTALALNGADALKELENDEGRFQILFSDVVMPGMSGLELAQEVRRLRPALPIILTSGYSHVLAQNGRHGFELLHKPYSIEQLSRVFRKCIAWKAL
ncbi:ATP-binding protein [Sphingomonas sp. BK069]|uniref:ATP-binding protein n=1 Tax=Sphingomonas sp. BK069 TaxID=2586979 RepID=UPI0017FE14D1|nr:ATP-binding protein [Sphingomonas sp. BK069]MBB3349841.1 PAS domain S-box-containing protein [Sphingomonas sp. BK069]